MNKLKVILTVLLAIFVFTGCSLKKNDEAIVKVNDTVITKNDFEKAYDSVTSNNMFSQMGIDLKNDKENVFSLMMQEKVISELIVNALVNEEMEKLKKLMTTKYTLNSQSGAQTGEFGSFLGTTPMFFIIKDGKFKDGFYGAYDTTALKQFLSNNGIK